MSDVQVGQDWWLATDGRWYPPERHPNFRPPGNAPPATSVPPFDYDPMARQEVQSFPQAGLTSAPGLGGVPMTRQEVQSFQQRRVAGVNQLHPVAYRGGWIGLFAGENQIKALQRALAEINASGLRVVAAVEDRWSVWKRMGVVLLLLVTLGFVGKVPNVLLITEPGST